MSISKMKMADHIPFDIQAEIIKSCPIKSLIRFRLVSKPWKSLIDSSEFIADYHVHHTQPQHHLLLRYTHSNYTTEDFYSLIDDDTFPSQKFHLNVPISVKRHGKTRIIGSSHGLICFYNFDKIRDDSGTVVLWNPFIRKSIVVGVPNVLDMSYQTVVRFGVCCKTSDPKLVKISFPRNPMFSLPWQVEVFTLSSRTWRTKSINLPRKSIALCHKDLVVIDGVMHWLAFDRTNEVEFKLYNLVISFDLAREEFTEIYLPDKLVQRSKTLLMYKPTKSLAVVQYYYEDQNRVSDVWIMEHGVQKSFTKLFKVKVPNYSVAVLEFRKNGEAIIEKRIYSKKLVERYSKVMAKLAAYKPFSEDMNDLGFNRDSGSFSVTSYTESLLLLDHPDSIFHL